MPKHKFTLLALNGRRTKLDTQSLTETVCYTTNTVNCMYASVYTMRHSGLNKICMW